MEKNAVIWNSKKDGRTVLRSGRSCRLELDLSEYDREKRYSLYFTGETSFFPTWRNEVDFQHLYGIIDDSLNSAEAEGSRYCLDFSMRGGEGYVKRAVKKIVWKPTLFDTVDLLDGDGGTWNCGIYAKARNLKIEKGGFLRLLLEYRSKREDKDNGLTDNPPDRVEIIDIPEGSYDYRHFCHELVFPNEETASVVVYLEGFGYSGEVFFERPHVISKTGYNILPDFSTAVQNRPFYDWYGCNLSKREWPIFEIEVNGMTAFKGEHFEAMHRYPSFEFDIPDGCLKEGKNTVKITYYGQGREPAPFELRDTRLVMRPGGSFAVIGYGENACLGRDFPILVRTGRDRVEAEFYCEGGEVECRSPMYFEKAGLHAVRVVPVAMKNRVSFGFKCEGMRHPVTLSHVCGRGDDGVITGTGDAVYINFNTPEHFERYLEWYTENNVGELLTLRPIYRWGGTRVLSEKTYRRTAELLNGMNYRYSMMSDGRDIPGYDKHPSRDMINGKGFLGYQLHERDGQFFYWSYRAGTPRQNFQILDEFYDICMRMYREDPRGMTSVYKPCNVKMSNGKYSLRMDVDNGYDSEQLANGVRDQLRDIKDSFTRHTGPTVNFRSFFKAGFDWLGAETLHSTTEVQLAFLRGASRAYGSDSFGVHAAIQWSNRPHGGELRERFYRLSLYVPYLCGVTEINTEEGLYRIEAGYGEYDRYSPECLAHLKQQRDFNRYVTGHTRKGRLYSPIAMIYGNDDMWTGYNTSTNLVCGTLSVRSGDLSTSWNILNVFYPDACIGCNKPYKIKVEEKTYIYTKTPYGNVDVIPIEDGDPERYRLLSFAGYNRAEKHSLDRLAAYMESGGRLIVGWPHLSDTADVRDATEYRHTFSDNAIISLIGGAPRFIADSIDGRAVRVSESPLIFDEVICKTDSGAPLAVSKRVGRGELVFVNALEYPGNDSVCELYKKLLTEYGNEAVANETVWVECGDGVEFSAYDDTDGTRYFYIISVDYVDVSGAEKTATLRVGDERYDISFPFGRLVKVAVRKGIAVWSDSERLEISEMGDRYVRVEADGDVAVFVAANGKVSKYTPDFSDSSEAIIQL